MSHTMVIIAELALSNRIAKTTVSHKRREDAWPKFYTRFMCILPNTL